MKITERHTDRKQEESAISAPTAASVTSGSVSSSQVKVPTPTSLLYLHTVSLKFSSQVNKTIQMLAQQYCNECKTSFEELSKIIQKVLVSRKELIAYDRRHNETTESLPHANTSDSEVPAVANYITRCYGCASAATEHCLTLLRALATNTSTRKILCSKGLIRDLVWNNLRRGSIQVFILYLVICFLIYMFFWASQKD